MNRFDHFLIAASHARIDRGDRPSGALPQLDEKIIWGDLKVQHHGNLTRLDKINELREYLNTGDLSLRVCLRSEVTEGILNDGICDKCARTILALVVNGIDPNKCGFKVNEETWMKMKKRFENRRSSRLGLAYYKIKEISADDIPFDFNGSREFLKWFRDFDLKAMEKNWFWTDVHTSLPYELAVLLEKVLNKFKIRVQGTDSFVRE